jgi:hypothetical protein
MTHVRNWLKSHVPAATLMGGAALGTLYKQFTLELPSKLAHARLEASEITFVDWTQLIKEWLSSANLAGKA